MVICLELRAVLHMAQLMPLPLTVSCFSEIQIVFTFLGNPGKRAVKQVCVCVLFNLYTSTHKIPYFMKMLVKIKYGFEIFFKKHKRM